MEKKYGKMKKVKEIQEYLEKKGIIASETVIVNAAIDIVRRIGPGDYSFVCALKEEKKKE